MLRKVLSFFECNKIKHINVLIIICLERYRIGYSWKNIVDSIDFRNTSINDVSTSLHSQDIIMLYLRNCTFQWVFEGYNLSLEFRSFQESTITQVKKNPFLCYQNDVQKIL